MPSALPLSTKLGTAVIDEGRGRVDAVTRPFGPFCGVLRRAKKQSCQSAARTRTLAEPAPLPVPPEPWRDQYTTPVCRSRREPTSPFHRKVGSPTCKAKPARRDYQQFGVRGIVRGSRDAVAAPARPRTRSSSTEGQPVQRRQVGSSHKPALARDDRTQDHRTANKDAATPGHSTAAGPAPQRRP